MGRKAIARRPAVSNAPGRSLRRGSLIDALFSRTQQRVLALLFGQPDRSFFATELISLAGSGSGAVQRELQRLKDSGLVVVTRVGNQKHFRANPSSPLFEELRSIVLKTVAMVEPLKRALAPLAKHIELALLYGSVAKRADTASSDIDLLIVSNLPLERLYAALAPFEHAIGRKIDPTLYSPKEFRARREANNAFITKVLGGERIVLIGDERADTGTRAPR